MSSSSAPSIVLATNGIDATTGEPLLPDLTLDRIARHACSEALHPAEAEELRRWVEAQKEDHLDTRFEIDLKDLAETGWGVVFPEGREDERRASLAPLLERRREQAGGRYRELAYRPGESKARFLARHRVGPGPADPDRLPYYLLLAGDPEEIPFRFQHQMGVQYAAGRLDFPAPAEYASYAASVVAAESQPPPRPRKISLFGVANPGDRATALSLRQLIEPLALSPSLQRPGWTVETLAGPLATKAALAERLGGEETPALLLSASHGIGLPPDHPLHRAAQGALLCQDWPGPGNGPLTPGCYMAASDLPDAASLHGLIAFFFACYGAGTPRFDSFSENGDRRELACESFVSRLPQCLLGHPNGGALAVIGHVDRAWSTSFDWPEADDQLQVFEGVFGWLLDGYPVGAAMEGFSQRYAELASDLREETEAVRWGAEPDFLDLAWFWTAAQDARSYVVLGDPAVRLPWAAGS